MLKDHIKAALGLQVTTKTGRTPEDAPTPASSPAVSPSGSSSSYKSCIGYGSDIISSYGEVPNASSGVDISSAPQEGDVVSVTTPTQTPLVADISTYGEVPNASSGVDISSAAKEVDVIPANGPTMAVSPSAVDADHGVESAFISLSADKTCDVTGFTGSEKRLLWASWKRMTEKEEDMAVFGRNLVNWMYEYVPTMPQRLFDGWADEVGYDEAAKKFMKHVETLISELHDIVMLLPEPDKLMDRVNTLMDSHIAMSPLVGTAHFKPFHDNFYRFVRHELGKPAGAHIVQLWVRVVGLMYTTVEAKEAEFIRNKELFAANRALADAQKEEEEENTSNCCCRLM